MAYRQRPPVSRMAASRRVRWYRQTFEGIVRVLSRFRAHGLLTALFCVVLVVGVLIADQLSPSAPEASEPQAAPEAARPASEGTWVTGWAAAPTGGEPENPLGLPDRTVRNVVQPTVGGSAVRVEISNRYGDAPLRITHATVALALLSDGPAARGDTLRRLAFDGADTVVIPVGESVFSDPARLRVPFGSQLLISVYAPDGAGPVTYHRMARQTSFLASGDQAADSSGARFTEPITDWRYVTSVQLLSQQARGAVVVLGDSLTDGITSSIDRSHRWTDFLAQRLREDPGAPAFAVVNAGISGNRLLRPAEPDRPFNGDSGLTRLRTDALDQQGVSTLVLQLGINDLIRDPAGGDPVAVLNGMRRVVSEARAEGVRVAGVTLMPFEGHTYWTPQREAVRQRINDVIRGGGVFDAVLDFDAALRDPTRHTRLLPRYDSGDGLHPSDFGFAAMAQAVDLYALAPGSGTQL